MEIFGPLIDALPAYLPALGTVAVVGAGLFLANRLLAGRENNLGAEAQVPRQVTMLLLTAAGLVMVVLAVPMETDTRGQILSLLGLVFTGVIALSSTTFVSNVMAGLMLRAIRSFRQGDYIQVGDWFGRVTERGLFHTEIQSEDRDLVTLPNMVLVTTPVKVVRKSGTVVSADVSLGYDAPRGRVERALKAAASDAGLADAFVHLKSLGDFSVGYRVAGFLDDTDRLLTTRSRLLTEVLDHLHRDGIEIVSPSFMNTRALDPKGVVLPHGDHMDIGEVTEEGPTVEDVAFDKAARAGELEQLRELQAELAASIKASADLEEAELVELRRREAECAERIERLSAEIDQH